MPAAWNMGMTSKFFLLVILSLKGSIWAMLAVTFSWDNRTPL